MIQTQPVTRILRKSTQTLMAAVMAIGLLASASQGRAENLIWTSGAGNWASTTAWTTNLFTVYTNTISGVLTNQDPASILNCLAVIPGGDYTNSVTLTNCVGGVGGPPSDSDTALFTNAGPYSVTVNALTSINRLTLASNSVVTINAGGSMLTVTNRLQIGTGSDGSDTATVYWAGGTLRITDPTTVNMAQMRIGIGPTNGLGVLVVTNGTVQFESGAFYDINGKGIRLGSAVSAGKLVISGSGVVTNVPTNFGTIEVGGGGLVGSQLIVTNGGKLFIDGYLRAGNASNCLTLISGSTSTMSVFRVNSFGGAGALDVGTGGGQGNRLIVSNGATLLLTGEGTIGRGSHYNTGIVVGAGSKWISELGSVKLGATAAAFATKNFFMVYDGGYVYWPGTAAGGCQPGSAANANSNTIQIGGVGAMSTAIIAQVSNNSGTKDNQFIVTNAFMTCSQLSPNSNNYVYVRSLGTVVLTNAAAVANATPTNVLTAGRSVTLTIDGGTLNAVSVGGISNVYQTVIGNNTSNTTLVITNGGKLLTEISTFGQGSAFNTAIVTGNGSVWSNSSALGSNTFNIGSGVSSNNYLAVLDGARLVNNGTLNIGNSPTSTVNSVFFGGQGLPSTIINSLRINVGDNSGASNNTLTVSNATVTCDVIHVGSSNTLYNTLTLNGGKTSVNHTRVWATNTIVFTAGTLSAGGMEIETGANGGNVFVAGDGTTATFYDMAAGGIGDHSFGNGGLVVTNGAALRGTGIIYGNITVLGAFTPGLSVGSIYVFDNLAFGPLAVLNYELGTSSDSVGVNGNLALGGTINVTSNAGFTATTYTLFTHTGTVTGTLSVGTLPPGYTATVSTNTPTLVQLIVTAVGGDPFTAWQTYYFGGNTGTATPGADPDGDGVSNTNEFLTGFNPTNSAAFARITSIGSSGGGTNQVVSYLGASGDSSYAGGPASRTNVLEFSPGTNIASVAGNYTNNFSSTGLTNALSGGTGLGSNVTHTISGAATNRPARYYRVRVLAP